jgi:hypothetical protein
MNSTLEAKQAKIGSGGKNAGSSYVTVNFSRIMSADLICSDTCDRIEHRELPGFVTPNFSPEFKGPTSL